LATFIDIKASSLNLQHTVQMLDRQQGAYTYKNLSRATWEQNVRVIKPNTGGNCASDPKDLPKERA
jgi:hypothetical protein